MNRTLSLNREALAELTTDELLGIAGAQDIGPTRAWSCPLIECVNSRYIPCTV